MAKLSHIKEMNFNGFIDEAKTVSPTKYEYIYTTPDNKKELLKFNKLVEYTANFNKKSLLDLKNNQGWKSSIRNSGDIEIDHLRISFSKDETNIIRASNSREQIQALVIDTLSAQKRIRSDKKNDAAPEETGQRWSAVTIHDDTNHFHIEVYRSRHSIDLDNRIIYPMNPGAGKSELDSLSMEIERKISENLGFNFQIETSAKHLKEDTETRIQVSEEIKEMGGFGSDIRSASKIELTIDAQQALKNQQFVLDALAQKQREVTELQEIVVIAQQAAAALTQRDIAAQEARTAQAAAEAAEEARAAAEAQAQAAEDAAAVAEVERAAYEAQALTLTTENTELNEKMQLMEVETEEKINELTDNHESIIEKLKDDNEKVVKSYQVDFEALKANNLLLSESLIALRENNELMKQSLLVEKDNVSKLTKDNDSLNQSLTTEKDNVSKLTKDNEFMGNENERFFKELKALEEVNKELEEKNSILDEKYQKEVEDWIALNEEASKLRGIITQKDDEIAILKDHSIAPEQLDFLLQQAAETAETKLKEELDRVKKDNESFEETIKKQVEMINERNAELNKQSAALNQDYLALAGYEGVIINNDYKKSKEWQNLSYAGAYVKKEDGSMQYPPGFNSMPEFKQKQIALDMFVASQIAWGDNWSINCKDEVMLNTLKKLRDENKTLVQSRAESFLNKSNMSETMAEKTVENGVSFDEFEKKNKNKATEIKEKLLSSGFSEEDIMNGLKIVPSEKIMTLVNKLGDYYNFDENLVCVASDDQAMQKQHNAVMQQSSSQSKGKSI